MPNTRRACFLEIDLLSMALMLFEINCLFLGGFPIYSMEENCRSRSEQKLKVGGVAD